MGPKLLFVLGIVVTHAAVGAAWIGSAEAHPRAAVSTCTNAEEPMPHFAPQAELLAMHVSSVVIGDTLRP